MATNLIPQDLLKELYYNRLYYLIWYVGIMLTTLVFVGVILLVPSYLLLVFQNKEAERSVGVLKNSAPIQEVEDYEQTLTYNNKLLERYYLWSEQQDFPSDVFEKVIDSSGDGIIFQSVRYSVDRRVININGSALNRRSLILYVDKIKEDPLYENINAPIEQRIREGEGPFSISMQLKK